ncbi:hypothetical protein TNCV_3114361 [Trichonephila clavipes]|nr:hypothetical protein TNCV_3114361 [Trichonephila clavipes]
MHIISVGTTLIFQLDGHKSQSRKLSVRLSLGAADGSAALNTISSSCQWATCKDITWGQATPPPYDVMSRYRWRISGRPKTRRSDRK